MHLYELACKTWDSSFLHMFLCKKPSSFVLAVPIILWLLTSLCLYQTYVYEVQKLLLTKRLAYTVCSRNKTTRRDDIKLTRP
jgi:hypothetical protein